MTYSTTPRGVHESLVQMCKNEAGFITHDDAIGLARPSSKHRWPMGQRCSGFQLPRTHMRDFHPRVEQDALPRLAFFFGFGL